MNTLKIYFFLAIFLAGIFPTFGQVNDSLFIRKMADDIMVNSGAYENLRFLCKKVGPRLSGSPNAEKALEVTARMLKEAGADTVYWQPCMVPHWVRGEKETGYIQLQGNERIPLRLCALGNSVGTGQQGVMGEVMEVNSMEALDQLGEKAVKGKIIFFNIPMNPANINSFRSYGESGVGRRIGPAQASKYGAIAVLVRSLASNVDDYPHTGATQYNDSFPKIPAVAISTRNAEILSLTLKKSNRVTVYFKTNCEMLPDIPSFNVIGEISGSEFPAEIISVGGHLDSWDLAEGAQDDGSGIVQSIEIIRAFKAAGVKPKRTVRAVMFMNEENGGRGGNAYLQAAITKKEHHIFALESDAGGFSPRAFSFDMDQDLFTKVSLWKNLFYPYGVYEFRRGGGGSDIAPLKKIGTALAGLSPDSQRYFDLHHAETDTFETVSKRELDLGALNMAALIWLISEYGL